MKISLWVRVVLYKIFKLLGLYLIGFYSLYSFVDSSTRWHDFAKNPSLHFLEIVFYYILVFIKRLDIILPLAFMIALVKVFIDMNQKRESIALFTSGLKKQTFLIPFFFFSGIVSCCLFLNFEYLTPRSLLLIEDFEAKYFNASCSAKKNKTPYFVQLSNQKLLIYSHCTKPYSQYQDVYYIISPKELWKLSSVILNQNLEGFEAEQYLIQDNTVVLQSRQPSVVFDQVSVVYDSADLNDLTIECGSFSFLMKTLKKLAPYNCLLYAKISCQFFYKITVLFLPVLITMICACFGLIFSRKLPIFMIYAMSIFGMIGYFLLMDAAIILGETQLLPSYLALLGPLLLIFVFILPRFIRSCKT